MQWSIKVFLRNPQWTQPATGTYFQRWTHRHPALVLLFGADIKLAGSLSFAVSLPTMLVGFTLYSRDQSFSAVGGNRAFLLVVAVGSIAGTFIGGLLPGVVPNAFFFQLWRLSC